MVVRIGLNDATLLVDEDKEVCLWDPPRLELLVETVGGNDSEPPPLSIVVEWGAIFNNPTELFPTWDAPPPIAC